MKRSGNEHYCLSDPVWLNQETEYSYFQQVPADGNRGRPQGKRQHQLFGVLAIEFSHESMSLHDVDLCENSSMLTVHACQQHRLVVMQPNKAKSFPAATVWYTAAVENVVPKARKVGMLGGHTRVSKSADDGEVEACWECCAPNTPEG